MTRVCDLAHNARLQADETVLKGEVAVIVMVQVGGKYEYASTQQLSWPEMMAAAHLPKGAKAIDGD